MTLKLNHSQAEALRTLFNDVVLTDLPVSMEDKLLSKLMVKIYRKLRNKLEGRPGMGYSITLTDEEAIAYYLYFCNRSLPTGYLYEHNTIQSHIHQIDKSYA